VVNTTADSPSEGSTPPTYSRNGRARADHQHAAAGQLLAVGVEQVGHAVQRDRGLPGAGPPSITTVPPSGSRITASCSAWIVATMSRIASRGARRARPAAPGPPRCASVSVAAVKTSSWMSTTRSCGAVPASWKWRRRTTPIGLASVAQ
jgi:hypothetical protein